MTARIITVSATYGAGGSIVGPLLARKLDLPFVDRLFQPDHAKAQSAERVTKEERDEEPAGPLLKSFALLSSALGFSGPQDAEDVPQRLRREVEASLAPVCLSGGVVLGRAGAVALATQPGAFHVRLDGPKERRVRRGALWEGVDLATARAHLEETDNARARYLERVYDRKPTDPSLYHLMLDVTVVGSEAATEVIAAAAQAAWSFDEDNLAETIAALRSRLAEPNS